MSKKFIPNGDLDFSSMAGTFARALAKDTERYFVPQTEADELLAAVAQYQSALQASRFGERSSTKVRLKEDARSQAEEIIRRLANVIRANPKVDAIAKMQLGLRERVARAKILPCPQEPPKLKFVRALHEGSGATPMHELSFSAMDWTVSKPAGAVRLELFVDLVPPEEKVPNHPGANLASRPWYLRSFTRSPIKLIPPMARVPMRVVYWARWADSTGNVGPFSSTVTGWIEGGMHKMLAPAIAWDRKPVPMMTDASPPGGPTREPLYSVAVLEAQYQSMRENEVGVMESKEVRQLEDQSESEAA